MSFQVVLRVPTDDTDLQVRVHLGGPQSEQSRIKVGPGAGAATDDFGDHIAATVWEFFEQITPIVDALEDAGNQMDATLSPNVPRWSPSMRPPSVDFPQPCGLCWRHEPSY